MFSPQVGDFNGDGRFDIVTGSNCCGYDWCHWFSVTDNGMHSKRYDLHFSVDKSQFRIEGKNPTRPYLLDWNRDGKDDLVLVLIDNLSTYDESTKTTNYDYRYRIFTNTDSHSRATKLREGRAAKAKRIEADGLTRGFNIGAPRSGADLEIKLDHFEFEHEEFNQKVIEKRPVQSHFSFADFDGDGNTDVLYSQSEYFRDIVRVEQGSSYRTYRKIESSIYCKRNLTSEGEPRFDKAVKLFDTPEDWIIHSISTADLDNDGNQNVIVNVFRGNTKDTKSTESELWMLKPRQD